MIKKKKKKSMISTPTLFYSSVLKGEFKLMLVFLPHVLSLNCRFAFLNNGKVPMYMTI